MVIYPASPPAAGTYNSASVSSQHPSCAETFQHKTSLHCHTTASKQGLECIISGSVINEYDLMPFVPAPDMPIVEL